MNLKEAREESCTHAAASRRLRKKPEQVEDKTTARPRRRAANRQVLAAALAVGLWRRAVRVAAMRAVRGRRWMAAE
jgi:hypothetical protein